MTTAVTETAAPAKTTREHRDYIKLLEATCIEKQAELTNRITKMFFQRQFDYINFATYNINQIFPTIIKDEALLKEAFEVIDTSFRKVLVDLDKLVAQSNVLMDANGVSAPSSSRPEAVTAKCFTPQGVMMLRVIMQSDNFLRLNDALWIEGVIDNAVQAKNKKEVKALLRRVNATVLNIHQRLKNKRFESPVSPGQPEILDVPDNAADLPETEE